MEGTGDGNQAPLAGVGAPEDKKIEATLAATNNMSNAISKIP